MSGILFGLPPAFWPAAELFLLMARRLGRSRKTGGVPCRVAARWQCWGRRGRAQQFGTGAESSSTRLGSRLPEQKAIPSHHRRPSLSGPRAGPRKVWRFGGNAGGCWAWNTADRPSLQKRALEVKLKVGGRTEALGKETPQMLHRLEQRIGLRAGGRLLLPAKHRAHLGQLLAQPMQQMIKRLQRKGQGQRLGRRFDGTPGQQANEQPPQPWPRHRMARQHVGQENGEAPPTAAALAPVAAPHPLAPLPLGFPVPGARVVAVELAMAV